MNKFEIEVINALRELEIPAHMHGYGYIKSAMNHLHDNPQSLYFITKELYPAVAEKHNTTPSRVERGIRHALASAYSDFLIQKKVLGTSRDLVNSEFLATLHEVIKIKMATNKEEGK